MDARHRIALALGLVAAPILFLAGGVIAAPGDARTVTGTLEWPTALTNERFVVLRAADGAHFYIDLGAAQRASLTALAAGDRISVVAVEGQRPHELHATALVTGDVRVAVAPPPPPPPVAVPPPLAAVPVPPARSEPQQRIDGRVESLNGSTLVLRTDAGATVTADASRVVNHVLLSPGTDVTIFGTEDGWGHFVASGLVVRTPVEEDSVSQLPLP
jgi:hypothetical protein